MAWNYSIESASIGSIGRHSIFSDWNYTVAQLRGVGKATLGQTEIIRGNLYQAIQNRSGGDLNYGDVVSLYFNAATRIGNLTGASNTYSLTTDDTLDAGLGGNDSWPGMIGVTAGVFATANVQEQLRQIWRNSTAAGASTVDITDVGVRGTDFIDGPVNGAPTTNPDVIAAPDATFDYEIFCPWEVVKTDLDALVTSVPQGVVCSTTITNSNCGVIQVGGICIAKVDGTTDLVSGDMLIPDSAAGVLSKWVVTTTDPTTAQINQAKFVFGRILGAYTNNGVNLRVVLMENRPLLPAQGGTW